ncbi:MAG: hypothetical protein M1817_001581 [Caeruleum heppii]|nr:MAG: hypothetical protein M1817_001581 [Caeruleum heppii]
MDIFVRNIPDQASNKNLRTFFAAQFRPFGIDAFLCQKLKRRGCATLTILDPEKAQCFLTVYGGSSQKGRQRTQTKTLKYMDRDLYCVPSKFECDEWLLETLRKEQGDNRTRPRNKIATAASTEKDDCQFDYISVQCGYWDFQSSGLVFLSQATDRRSGSIMFGRKSLALVAHSNTVTQEKYRLDIFYPSIQSITTGNLQDPSVTITLSEAPRVYQETTFDPNALQSLFESFTLRTRPQLRPKRRRVESLSGTHLVAVSNCFVYRLLLSNPSMIYNIAAMLQKGWDMPPAITWPTSVITPRSSYLTEMNRLTSALCEQHPSLAFNLRFQVQRLAQNGFLTPSRVLELLPSIRQSFDRSGGSACAEAVRRLSRQLPFAGPETDGKDFSVEHLEKLLKEDELASTRELAYNRSNMQQHAHIGLVHRATVTPAGIYLEGPDPETTNRVLRAYADHADHFIRVTFSDEDGEPIRFDRFASLEEIFHSRFKRVLNGVIPIAGHDFEFLGFSHSSLRDQTCWFMAPFEHDGMMLSATAVIANLGDFSGIRSPAKCAARIGQAFSDTVGAVRISPTTVAEIPDVERNGRVFSDGVGTVSADILAKLWKQYSRARNSRPTLYQIRFAGAKGMISLDTRLRGEALLLRQSMIKFTGSDASDLEICGSASRPLPTYLNRQYIKIMEDLGIDPNVLMELQDNAVERLRRTTLSAVNAANFLERELIGLPARVPWLIRELHDRGFEFLEDPFLRGTVELAVLSRLRELKHRSRILVEQAVTLYGIMDETDTLAEDEIYCCNDKEVIMGKVTITRAPALHPGDIQIVNAVDVPEDSPLNALHNCIVFSQRGQRDLPSQLSGGDLDGDIYSVIYDERLLPPRVVAPADYPRVAPKDIGRVVTKKDMTDFFVEFMENDQLGRIATLHMQLADRREGGTQHSDCITLAELHSTAVDFSKTGIPVDMSKCPRYDLNRPDFMAPSPRMSVEKGLWALEEQSLQGSAEEEEDLVSALDPDAKSYRYYESKNILGQLYRAIDEKEFLAEIQRQARQLEYVEKNEQTMIRRLWAYVLRCTALVQWDHYRTWAREIKEAYETQLLNTIYQFSTSSVHLISELEVFVGTLLGKNGGVRTKRLREMSMGMKEQFERDVAFTINCIAKGSQEEGKGEALERSLACFAVAIEEPSDMGGNNKRRLESFRYVAAAVCLGEVERFQRSSGLPFLP